MRSEWKRQRLPFPGKRVADRNSFYEFLRPSDLDKTARIPADWTNSEIPFCYGVLIFAGVKRRKRVYAYTSTREFWKLGDRIFKLHIGGVTGTGRPYFGIRPNSVSPTAWKIEPTSGGGIHLYVPGRLIVLGPTTINELEIFAVKAGSHHFHR